MNATFVRHSSGSRRCHDVGGMKTYILIEGESKVVDLIAKQSISLIDLTGCHLSWHLPKDML
jgi:hypothetical protein